MAINSYNGNFINSCFVPSATTSYSTPWVISAKTAGTLVTRNVTRKSLPSAYQSQILGYVPSPLSHRFSHLPLQEGDEEKINHRIPHRFEPLTNIGANWCCHCGYMLPLGRKNARKCSECDITCHANCAHLVPDFCGMSMETANQLLRDWRDINRARGGKAAAVVSRPIALAPTTQTQTQVTPPAEVPLSDSLDRMQLTGGEVAPVPGMIVDAFGRRTPTQDGVDPRYYQQQLLSSVPPRPPPGARVPVPPAYPNEQLLPPPPPPPPQASMVYEQEEYSIPAPQVCSCVSGVSMCAHKCLETDLVSASGFADATSWAPVCTAISGPSLSPASSGDASDAASRNSQA